MGMRAKRGLRHSVTCVLCTSVFAVLCGCAKHDSSPVVVYTALDQSFSEPVLALFEERSGIEVRAVYDTEATKTVGLVNRLLAERDRPRCDVLWNNEVVRTVMLKRRGVLAAYESPSAADIPAAFRDSENYWTGFAARARVLIYNTEQLEAAQVPFSIEELGKPQWRKRVSLAFPMFGTTATHAAALFAYMGDDAAREYFRAMKANGIVIVDGNASSKDAVARGEVPIGFTDTDDAQVALSQGKPVGMHFPDQGEGQMGTLVIPNTVSMIKGCPHPKEARQLIDFLLSREVGELLAKSGSAQMPLRPGIPVPEGNPSLDGIKAMSVDWDAVEARLGASATFLEGLFIR